MIYLLEDDDSIRKLVIYALKSQGQEGIGFSTPSAFWEACEKRLPELVLLDIMLPEEDGLQVLKKLRQGTETSQLPVILLTAKGAEYDRVEGLDAGADDYIVKPFGMMELLARIRAVLRRSKALTDNRELRVGHIFISPERHEVRSGDEEVALTNKEFQLLMQLAENRGLVMTRSVLMDRVWGLGGEPENRTLDVHIRSLRMKLGKAGDQIETIRGVGYRLREDPA